MTSKGQVTIPKAIREQLRLRLGDKLDLVLDEAGGLRVEPVTGPVTELKGMLPKPRCPVALVEMEKAIAASGGRAL